VASGLEGPVTPGADQLATRDRRTPRDSRPRAEHARVA